MNIAFSLASRTFLFSFLPMCGALIASFLAMQAAVKVKLKDSLKASFYKSEAAIAKTESDYKRNNAQFLAVLTENAGLKAAIGPLRETSSDPGAEAAVRRTIQASLWDLGAKLEFDFLAVADPRQRVLAAITGRNGPHEDIGNLPPPGESRLIREGQNYYEAATAPINLGEENLGGLTYGIKLDLGSLAQTGQIALIHDKKILLSTLSQIRVDQLEKELGAQGVRLARGGEIALGGETYLALPVRKARFGGQFELLNLQSLDAAMAVLTGSLGFVFGAVGACGLLLVLLVSAAGSRSIVKPLTGLIRHLQRSGEAGQLQPNFLTRSPVKEVNLLAEAFNQAADSVRDSQDRLEEAYVQFVETMAEALDARDCYTAGHSRRVCAYSIRIAETMSLSPEQMRTTRIGARLHDIGKIGIPDAVLQKPAPLTDSEYGLIKMHPQIGKRILEKLAKFAGILPVVELHHENHDGSGYPHGLRGEQIPLPARIVHVADAYDAMTSNRAYRPALPQERVLEELRKHAGRQFDPAIVEAFISVLIGSDTHEILHDKNLESLSRVLTAPAMERPLARATA